MTDVLAQGRHHVEDGNAQLLLDLLPEGVARETRQQDRVHPARLKRLADLKDIELSGGHARDPVQWQQNVLEGMLLEEEVVSTLISQHRSRLDQLEEKVASRQGAKPADDTQLS